MKYTILVVDDDRFVHMFIETAIETELHDYRIISAFNGKEACEIAYSHEIDLIIMDWEMPVMNGIEALEQLKGDPNTNDIPVIIITSSGNLQTAFDAGAIDFLRKPIDQVELLVRVKSTLSMFKLIKNIVKQTEILEQQSHELEQKHLTLKAEQKKSDDLLQNILPYEIAEQLKNKGEVDAKTYRKVSVLFTDFKGFTKISEKLSPQEIIKELGIFFAKFDEIIGGHFIEKIKTIGDAYMCVGGLPLRNKSNPIDTVLAGLEMQEFVDKLNVEKIAQGQEIWNLRLGIHTGKVVAGVIGKKKFAYDIWGDTVNTAARMESAGEIGKVNISGETYKHIQEYFDCEYRGKIEAKNKGEIDMYFVHGLKPEFAIPGSKNKPNNDFLGILSEY
ncbi:MAG: adenylate/guanylate cyclase domain-containing protein [Bacteroidales bacterium]|nr:adenylate/guanylate cyclase domain-containing protein [Bacteroidales bacterium]